MDKDEVITVNASIPQTVDAVVDRLLTVVSTIENPSQLRHHKLVGVRLKDCLPAIKTHNSDGVNVWMTLESQ